MPNGINNKKLIIVSLIPFTNVFVLNGIKLIERILFILEIFNRNLKTIIQISKSIYNIKNILIENFIFLLFSLFFPFFQIFEPYPLKFLDFFNYLYIYSLTYI